MGKRLQLITDFDEEEALCEGTHEAYLERNLRYSQIAPLTMYEEKNTANNMPAQIEIYSEDDEAFEFLLLTKGGGRANKTFLFQDTPAVLRKDRLLPFFRRSS